MARITLALEDTEFANKLAEAIRSEGHEVVRVGQGPMAPPPEASDDLEIAITQATGQYAGLRVRVTRLPAGKACAGALALLLAAPVVDVEHAMAALKQFVR